jgi:hypothetical protein
MNVVMNNASGHIHHGAVDTGTAETGAVAASWASPCPPAASAAGAAGAGSFDANTVPAAVSMAKTASSTKETFKQRCTIFCPFFSLVDNSEYTFQTKLLRYAIAWFQFARFVMLL